MNNYINLETIAIPFINWKSLPPLKPGQKNRKVPWANGIKIDSNISDNWLTYKEAAATGLPVGMVLSEHDPYFLLDLDDCRNPKTGAIAPGVEEIFKYFNNCAYEISTNGTGFHIMGQCADIGPRKHKFVIAGVDCEWYRTKRFIAMGQGIVGELNIDWTAHLQQFVPINDVVEKAELDDQPVPEWTGPEDDDELLKMAHIAKGSASQIFGTVATFTQLFNGDVEALGEFFPSTANDQFDRSSAELALMTHLAFWTGKNAARMDRLFRRSALVREKYLKRPGYQKSTISMAVSGSNGVYDKPKAKPAKGSNRKADGLMTIENQLEHFKGCVYVSSTGQIMDMHGNLMDQKHFRVRYGGFSFMLDSMGKKNPVSSAFEAFTENRVYQCPIADGLCFKIDQPCGAIIQRGTKKFVNMYFDPQVARTNEDVSLFLNHLNLLFPNPTDREIIISWMAAMIQHPGVKFRWAPVIQGVPGNGKSFLAEVMCYMVGGLGLGGYAGKVSPDSLKKNFNSWLSSKLFTYVEEMNIKALRSGGEDILKDYVVANAVIIEHKGEDSYVNTDYCANWMFLTNHKNAVPKDRMDRRYSVFFTAQQTDDDLKTYGMNETYFKTLFDWFNGGGNAAIAGYLMGYEIKQGFNPATDCFRSPTTSSEKEAIRESYSRAEQMILECIENDVVGYRGGWVSTAVVSKLMSDNNIRMTPNQLAKALVKLGYEKHSRSKQFTMNEPSGSGGTILYIDRNVATADYAGAQGYSPLNIQHEFSGSVGDTSDTTLPGPDTRLN